MIKPTTKLAGYSWLSKSALLAVFMSSLALPACVTINIYFPAAAAEKAADKIIDDIWQLQEGIKAAPAKAPNNEPDAK